MKRPANAENTLARIRRGARSVPTSRSAARSSPAFPGETEARVRGTAGLSRRSAARPRRLLRVFAGRRCDGQCAARPGAGGRERRAPGALHADAGAHQRGAAADRRSAGRSTCWSTRIDGDTAVARCAADAPEIDGMVRVAGGGKLKVRRVCSRCVVTGADAHDLRRAKSSADGGNAPARGRAIGSMPGSTRCVCRAIISSSLVGITQAETRLPLSDARPVARVGLRIEFHAQPCRIATDALAQRPRCSRRCPR